MKFDELNTLLIEIESVINGRPLTYVYDDSKGISYALTPAHLLYGHRLVTSPSATHFEIMSTNKALTRRSKNQWFLLNQFANCWKKDYLLSLCESRVTKLKGQASCVKVGDVVILKDDNVKRAFWKLAKIVELLKGKDDVARAALINVATDNGPPKMLRRSIKQLIPIEVASSEDKERDTSESIGNTVDNSESVNMDDQGLREQLQYWERRSEEIGLDFELVFAPLVTKQGECVRLYLVSSQFSNNFLFTIRLMVVT